MKMRLSLGLIVLAFIWLGGVACSSGGGGEGAASSSTSGGATDVPEASGRYTYNTSGGTAVCSDGTSFVVPAGSDTATVVQTGANLSMVLDISSSVPRKPGYSEDITCSINSGGGYRCDGLVSDDTQATTFIEVGEFSSTGFNAITELSQSILESGVVCSWSVTIFGDKI